MKNSASRRTVLTAAIATVLAFGVVAEASAQAAARAQERRARAEQQRSSKAAAKAEAKYPDATRTAPDAKASAKVTPKLQKMVKAYDDAKSAEAIALADEIIALPSANAYDRSFAAQIGAQAAYDADDTAAAMTYLKQALEFNGLDNSGHYDAMMMLGQLQLQEDQYAEALATFDRFLGETKSAKPEQLVLKGNALYRLERFPEASVVLKQAIDASPEPKADWLQLLMGTYFEMGKSAEAAQLAESIAAKNPADKRSQSNLAAAYLQGEMYPQAAAVMEKMRAAGLFTDEKDYRQLYATYANMEGKEKDVVAVIEDGLAKGVLKRDAQTMTALAQSYYFSDQPTKAIDTYKVAAPLAEDGETYLNLAKLLWQEDRISEAKEAARQAIAKGVKKPDDARKIIALPGK